MKQVISAFIAFASVVLASQGGLVDRVRGDFGDYDTRPFVHYALDPMSDIQHLPDAYPTDGRAGAAVRISLAKGEYEPGSFSVFATRDLGKVSFDLEDFVMTEYKNIYSRRGYRGKPYPKTNLDLKYVKCWYQNLNAWFSYFGDRGDAKLCPELLLNDEELIRCDDAKKANYARVVGKDGKVTEKWLNPPFEAEGHVAPTKPWINRSAFQPLAPGFNDADTLQPVNLPAEDFRTFFLTVRSDAKTPAGVYTGAVKLKDAQGAELGRIPVEIVVHNFELPHPKCYRDITRDFLVSSYSYFSIGDIKEWNGGDEELALKQFDMYYRNLAAHNQRMDMIKPGLGSGEWWYTLEAMKRCGMRTDVLQNFITFGTGGKEKGQAEALWFRNLLDERVGHHNFYAVMGDEPSLYGFLGDKNDMRHMLSNAHSADLKVSIAGGLAVQSKAAFLYDWANISQRPDYNEMLRSYNDSGAPHVAWYAHHHIGTENPSLNRRQNGLACYLAGYTALCNYAHHFGPYNDNTQWYKPMCDFYGTETRLIDTLGGEGFREGLDDIRYATLLMELATKARQSEVIEVRHLGGLALMHLARFDGQKGDLTWCRAEMVRYIEELLLHVTADKVVPYPVADPNKQLVNAADAAYRAEMANVEKMYREANGAPHLVLGAEREARRVADKYNRKKDLAEFLEKKGAKVAAADLFEGEVDFARAQKIREEVALDENANPNQRRAVLWKVLRRNPALGERAEVQALFTNFAKTNDVVRETWNVLGSKHRVIQYMVEGGYPTVTWFYERTAPLADAIGDNTFPFYAATSLAEAYVMTGRGEKVAEVVERAQRNENLKPIEVLELKMFRDVIAPGYAKPLFGTRRKAACDAMASFMKKNVGDLKNDQVKDVVARACNIANLQFDEDAVRGLDDYYKSLFVPTPKKRYTVRYTAKSVFDSADWEDLGVEVEKAVYDRPFGGSPDMMATDVTTGSRAVGNSDEKIPRTQMQVVADDWGIHFRFFNADSKAREIEAKLGSGGSFEAYLAPGKNEPYICFYMEDGQKLGVFNTTYDNLRNRNLDEDDSSQLRYQTIFKDGAIVTKVSFSWQHYTNFIPSDGQVWDFECMRWDRAGGDTWNGLTGIHERSNWGELVFELPQAARASILKGVAYAAYEHFGHEVHGERGINRYEGIRRWDDPWTGERSFWRKSLFPFVEELDAKGREYMTENLSDEDVFRLEREGTIEKWFDIVRWAEKLRADWLQ